MAIKKFNEEYSNKSDVKGGSYGSVNDTKKILDQTSGDYEEKWHEAVKYLNDKVDEIVDETNKGTVASGSYASNIKTLTSAVSTNTSKTGITSTQASRITANHSKTGITSTQASRITANHAKVGISTVQAAIVNNLHPEGGALIPTTTEKHTVSLSVSNSRGAYALVFTMVDSSGETPVTKATKVNLG